MSIISEIYKKRYIKYYLYLAKNNIDEIKYATNFFNKDHINLEVVRYLLKNTQNVIKIITTIDNHNNRIKMIDSEIHRAFNIISCDTVNIDIEELHNCCININELIFDILYLNK